MTPDEKQLLSSLNNAISNHTKCWAIQTRETSNQNFCENNGALTYQVAERLGISTRQARIELNKMVKRGLIHKSINNMGGYCRWLPAGYLQETKATGGM